MKFWLDLIIYRWNGYTKHAFVLWRNCFRSRCSFVSSNWKHGIYAIEDTYFESNNTKFWLDVRTDRLDRQIFELTHKFVYSVLYWIVGVFLLLLVCLWSRLTCLIYLCTRSLYSSSAEWITEKDKNTLHKFRTNKTIEVKTLRMVFNWGNKHLTKSTFPRECHVWVSLSARKHTHLRSCDCSKSKISCYWIENFNCMWFCCILYWVHPSPGRSPLKRSLFSICSSRSHSR